MQSATVVRENSEKTKIFRTFYAFLRRKKTCFPRSLYVVLLAIRDRRDDHEERRSAEGAPAAGAQATRSSGPRGAQGGAKRPHGAQKNDSKKHAKRPL